MTRAKAFLAAPLTLLGLAAMGLAFPWWLYENTGASGVSLWVISGAVVPALLLFACVRKTRNWSGITALCMIPYAAIGMMDIVATLGAPDAGMAIGVLSIVVFFSVLDAGRRWPDGASRTGWTPEVDRPLRVL